MFKDTKKTENVQIVVGNGQFGLRHNILISTDFITFVVIVKKY